MDLVLDQLLEFKPTPHAPTGVTHLRCWLDPERDWKPIAICGELDDQKGMSITNAIEQVAVAVDAAVADALGIAPLREDGFVLVEHYPWTPTRPFAFDLVSLSWDGREYQNPRWRPLAQPELFVLLGHQEPRIWRQGSYTMKAVTDGAR